METPFVAYTGSQPYVFVCYAHDDSDVVYPEMAWLRDQGVNLWYDEGISAGKNWRTAIGDSLLVATRVLFYVSAASLKSDHCNREINLALDEGKEVVPVYIEDVELTTDLKVGLNRVQALHRDEDASYQQHILNALGQSTTSIESPTSIVSKQSHVRLTARVGAGLALVLVIGSAWWYWPQVNEVPTPAVVPNGNSGVTDQTGSVRDSDQVEKKSIAVLALDNLSPDGNNAYFASGVHEEILNQLVKISDIQVTSRTTALRYENSDLSIGDIARELNVSTVLEGSVRFAGNRVRITTQLIRAADDVHLWSETYEFELDDIFAIQSDVAIKIANAMQATLSPVEVANIERPASGSTEAYTLFLQHRYQQDQASGLNSEAGIRKMEQAVALDPLYAKAFGELAYLTFLKGMLGPIENQSGIFDESQFYARKAIEMDPTIARAWSALSRVFYTRHMWDEWESYGRKSISLPDLDGRAASRFAFSLMLLGRFEEAHQWFDTAISKDPSSRIYRWTAVGARIAGGDYETALPKAEQFLAIGGDQNSYHTFRAYIYHRLDRQVEFLDEFSKISAEPTALSAIYYLAYMRCQSDERESVAKNPPSGLPDRLNDIRMVYCAAGAGDLDAVFKNLEQRMMRGTDIWRGNVNFDGIRDDARWQEVEEYMDFPSLK